MSDKGDKLLNLRDGKVLYDDLRDRIEGIDPGAQIDDTAGAGDTDKVWSADKSAGVRSDLLSAISALGLSVVDGKLCMTYEEVTA